MNNQWLVIVVSFVFLFSVIAYWVYEDNKKRKAKDAKREATLAAIGMLVAQHNYDEGVSAEIFSATFMLLGIHVNDQAAGVFNQLIEGTDNHFYFPNYCFRTFVNTRLDSGFTVKELLYRGDYAVNGWRGCSHIDHEVTEDF